MQGTYDSWLVVGSFLVAALASYAALELAGRVVVAQGRAAWAWLAGGSVAMGLGIWSMHFIGMLAFHLPIPLTYDLLVTLLSIVPAVLSAALVLALVRRGSMAGFRLAAGAILLGGGIAAMHYIGMAAIPIQPAIRYDPLIFAASIVVAIAVALVALKLAFSLSGAGARWNKFGAALVMGGAICAMRNALHRDGRGCFRAGLGVLRRTRGDSEYLACRNHRLQHRDRAACHRSHRVLRRQIVRPERAHA